MTLSDLSYLENLSEDFNINGGSCSLTAQMVNGKATAKSKGCPLKKKVVKKGSTTTYIFTAGKNRAVLSSSKDAGKSLLKEFSVVNLGLF